MQACHQASTAKSVPATAVLAGIVLVVSYSMSHSVVQVEGSDWAEPVIVWMAICMQTGTGKSSLYKFLRKLVQASREQCGLNDIDPSWLLEDQSFEKMGESMSQNHCKLFGLYDELSTFLSQINVCRGRGVGESHEVSIFLQLYGADPWTRRTGKIIIVCVVKYS